MSPQILNRNIELTKIMNLAKAREIVNEAVRNNAVNLNLSSLFDNNSLSDEDLRELVPDILKLKTLNSLDLSTNKISDASFIKELKSLTNLSLSNTQLNDYSFIKELKSLTSLYLIGNEISDTSFFMELKSLTLLYLVNNEISDASFVKELKSLTSLYFIGNEISNASFIQELKSLTMLDLSTNKITDVSFIKELKSLTYLNLSNNQISDVSFIKELKSLTNLTLSNNKINDYSFIKELKSLTLLDLSTNKISDISFIKELKSLTYLNLNNTQLNDYSFIKELKSLTSLTLSNNKIDDYSFIKELKSLTSLNLNNNKISNTSFIKNLKSLTRIYLDDNEISDASFTREFKSLTTLYLNNNQISDASFIKELPTLRTLDLRRNKGLLEKIPEEILNNPHDAQKIINYLITTESDAKPLNEAKIVVIGEADFGKTLLIRRLIYKDYVETKSTTGIKIERWKDVSVNGQDVQLNVWDFGGQEIMHSTHQFFFTKRTLYILVVNARRNEDRSNTEEWLKRIQSFGGDSPIIIVGTKIDQNQRDDVQQGQGYFDVSEQELKNKFVNIKGFYKVCSDVRKTKYDDKWQEFENGLIAEIGGLKNLHQPFPADWFAIKDQLQEMKDKKIPHISNNEYLKSCLKKNIEDNISQETIREFLNDIGIIIYFKDIFDKMIFNPEWITQGVYALTDNPSIIRNDGVLEFSQLEGILSPKGYTPEEHKFILDLMKKFELCVDIESGRRFLIPDLLLEVKEKYTGEWKNTLGFQYHYETFLKSIFTKFVVRMYRYIYQKTWWKNGVVLEHEGSKALVKFDATDKRVRINISGDNIKKRQYLLAIIRKEFKEIHGEFAALQVTEWAAHPTLIYTDGSGREVEILKDYEELNDIEVVGGKEIFVKELKRYFPISEWLDGVEDKTERLRNRNNNSREESEYIKLPTDDPTPANTPEIPQLFNQKIEKPESTYTNEELRRYRDGTKIDEFSSNITRLIEIIIGAAIIMFASFKTQEIIDSWRNGDLEPVSFIYTFLYLLGITFIFFGIFRNQISLEWLDVKLVSAIRWTLFKIKGKDLQEYKSLCQKIDKEPS